MNLSKKETFIPIFMALQGALTLLYGEITLGILTGIESNSKLILNDNNRVVVCEPYGLKTLEWIAKEAQNPEECQNAINGYYQQNPQAKNYARKILHMYQRYHYEKIDNKCILYAGSPETYNEKLLNEGIAIVDDKASHVEWSPKFSRAAERGKRKSTSVYTGDLPLKCKSK